MVKPTTEGLRLLSEELSNFNIIFLSWLPALDASTPDCANYSRTATT
nr:MAG TPA: hypothetical protein [Caudoviricetes sp.]